MDLKHTPEAALADAAPDTLAALKNLTEWFQGHTIEIEEQYPVLNELLREARVIIIRAEGRSRG